MPRDCLGKSQSRIVDVPSSTPTDEVVLGNETVCGETCPLCLRPALLEQDHDHRTELCRGRICHECNVHLGRFDRPIAEIDRFLEYLRFWAVMHAESGGRSYTEYMRVAVPGYRRGRRAPRRRKQAA